MKNNFLQHPRVLVLTSTFPRWSNDPEPAFVFELSRRLLPFFDVTVLAPRTPDSRKQEVMAGINVIRFPYFFNRWEKLAMHGGGILNKLRSNPMYYFLVPLFILAQLWKLILLLRKERFDLIHAHWLIPQGLIAVLGLVLTKQRMPLICTSHGSDLFALRGTLLQYLKRQVMNKSNALTVVSEAMKKTVENLGINQEKMQVISMGVDLKHLFTPDEAVRRNDNELLFVGRLVEGKGLEILLEALPMVLNKKPEVRLTVVGGGPMEGELRELSERLNVSKNVDFLGMIEHSLLPSLYRRATLAIFPFMLTKKGVQEGFGLVIVEAMGCECPVIAGDIPAIHDSVTHEENGLISPSGNSQALADSILRALDNPDWCHKLAENARRNVINKFDWDIIADKYIKLFDQLMNAKRKYDKQ